MSGGRFEPRWCGGYSRMMGGPRVPVQTSRAREIPEELARLAYEEYVAQGHGSQSFERLHERGGFGAIEIALHLADALERERHKHAPPASRGGEG